MKIVSILLAAGKGTRMRSKMMKVLHPLQGKPLVWHSIQQVGKVSQLPPVVIVGHQSEAVVAAVGDAADFIVQAEQLGTGHAVLQAKDHLAGKADLVLVVYGDMPLLRAETFGKLIETQKSNSGPISMLTIIEEDPRGFGRIVRNEMGLVDAIVEEVDCTPEQQEIKELNVGVYCVQADWLWENLPNVPLSAKGEYYLTDIIALARQQGLDVRAEIMEDSKEAMGINTRVHLAEAEAIIRRRTNEALMLSGVTMIDPNTTYIDAGVTIGQDTIIYPNTTIMGETEIGEDCMIGPNTIIRDAKIGSHCEVFASVIEQAVIEDHVDIGPFGHLRKGAHLLEGTHMGNFGEVKNATLGPNVKMGHFSYIGDATIKNNVNIGAGTITCNYDGKNKHHTTIEEDVFIGSDTMLVAPLHIGKGAKTGAGAVVTKDVAENDIVVGVPAHPLKKRDIKGE